MSSPRRVPWWGRLRRLLGRTLQGALGATAGVLAVLRRSADLHAGRQHDEQLALGLVVAFNVGRSLASATSSSSRVMSPGLTLRALRCLLALPRVARGGQCVTGTGVASVGWRITAFMVAPMHYRGCGPVRTVSEVCHTAGPSVTLQMINELHELLQPRRRERWRLNAERFRLYSALTDQAGAPPIRRGPLRGKPAQKFRAKF